MLTLESLAPVCHKWLLCCVLTQERLAGRDQGPSELSISSLADPKERELKRLSHLVCGVFCWTILPGWPLSRIALNNKEGKFEVRSEVEDRDMQVRGAPEVDREANKQPTLEGLETLGIENRRAGKVVPRESEMDIHAGSLLPSLHQFRQEGKEPVCALEEAAPIAS